MDFTDYLEKFKKAAGALDKKLLAEKGIEIQTGTWLDSVVLRLQKKHWANNPAERPHSGSAIFMSIWMDKKAIAAHKLLYNIHALRLRQLQGYRLQSRAFAESFRKKFEKFESCWPNVSVQFGPQTLMEGWKESTVTTLEKDVLELARQFLAIEPLVEETLNEYKR